MSVRRLALLLLVGALALAGLVLPGLPAQAQSAPVITPSQDTAAPPPATWSIRVQDSGWGRNPVSISFAGQQMANVTPVGGVIDTVITPTRRFAGTYAVTLSGNPCAPAASCPTSRGVGFRSIPVATFNDPCGPVGSTVTITVTGSYFPPSSFGYVFYDRGGPDQQSRQRIPTGNGTFTATFSVVVPDRSITINTYDVDGNVAPDLVWRPRPCPVATTTTSTSTPGSTTTSTTEPEETTTTRPSGTGSTTTTAPPSGPGPAVPPPEVALPPPTPGATLTLTPRLGPTGFVTGVRGTGFPPNAVVELRWQPGVGNASALTGADGTFTTRVLVLPNDRLGPRALVATSGATTAFDAFLVLPSTVQPSGGQSVAQITRVRRFLKR